MLPRNVAFETIFSVVLLLTGRAIVADTVGKMQVFQVDQDTGAFENFATDCAESAITSSFHCVRSD